MERRFLLITTAAGFLIRSALFLLLLLQALLLKSQFRCLLLVWIVLLFLVSHFRSPLFRSIIELINYLHDSRYHLVTDSVTDLDVDGPVLGFTVTVTLQDPTFMPFKVVPDTLQYFVDDGATRSEMVAPLGTVSMA